MTMSQVPATSTCSALSLQACCPRSWSSNPWRQAWPRRQALPWRAWPWQAWPSPCRLPLLPSAQQRSPRRSWQHLFSAWRQQGELGVGHKRPVPASGGPCEGQGRRLRGGASLWSSCHLRGGGGTGRRWSLGPLRRAEGHLLHRFERAFDPHVALLPGRRAPSSTPASRARGRLAASSPSAMNQSADQRKRPKRGHDFFQAEGDAIKGPKARGPLS